MNKYGVYATFGASVQKISQGLDGVFPLIDFTKNVSGGLAVIYNILCYVIGFTYQDPILGTRPIQAVFFGNKWFFTSQGSTVDFLAPVDQSGSVNMYICAGTSLNKAYGDTTSTIATTLKTALLPLDSPVFDKQFNRFGIELTSVNASTLTVQLDTELATVNTTALAVSYAIWQNNNLQTVSWLNNSTQTVLWINTGFILAQAYADVVGKYLGFTITSSNPQVIVNGLLAEYQPRAPW